MRSERWGIFALLFAARTTIAFQFQSVPAVGPLMVDRLLPDYATFGLLVGIYMLPGVALAFPGGLLDQRFGGKRVLTLGLALMAAGGASMAFEEPAMLFAGRLLSGSGAALLNVVLARAVSGWFAASELALVMGIFVASWPLGVALALVVFPPVMVSLGWTAVVLASVIPPMLCLAILRLGYRENPSAEVVPAAGLRPEISRRSLLLATIAGSVWGLYNVSYVVLVTSLPDFFVARGEPVTRAAAIASVLGWVMMITLPLGGYLAQRLKRPSLSIAACLAVIAVSAVGLAVSDQTVLFLTILAITIGLPAGVMMATPAQVLPATHRPAGMGVYFTVFYFAMATLPGVAGLVRETTGRAESPIVLAALTTLAALAAVLALGRLRRA